MIKEGTLVVSTGGSSGCLGPFDIVTNFCIVRKVTYNRTTGSVLGWLKEFNLTFFILHSFPGTGDDFCGGADLFTSRLCGFST